MIASNAGMEGAVVLGKVRESKETNFGFDAGSDEYTDMISAGILDPAKVTRTALQNAASISGLMLTTEALVSEIPEEEKAPAGPPMGGGAPGMY
jgi:chaperonin GroEL